MSGIQQLLLGGSPAGYQIERSLRFNSADSAYLSRTPASAGNRKTWTWSGWVKFSAFSGNFGIFYAAVGTGYSRIDLGSITDSTISVIQYNGSTYDFQIATSQVFRDVSAWYHIIIAFDTTQATNTNRVKVYVNGTQVTNFGTTSWPTQNFDAGINNNVVHNIGRSANFGPMYFSGYLTEVNFIDGQALTPSDFGETDSATGVWKPKKFSGTYGTNGFYLNFSDNSNTTAATLGKDSSGNGNNWTPNNFSVTAGVGNDSLVDTPTSYGTDTGAGGEVRGNYPTLSPIFRNDTSTTWTFSNGNLQYQCSSNPGNMVRCTQGFPVGTGKWYWETTVNNTAVRISTGIVTGINSTSFSGTSIGATSDSYGCDHLSSAGTRRVNNNSYTLINSSAASNGDVFMLAFDAAEGKLWFGRNGTWYGATTSETSANPATGTQPTFSGISTTTQFFPAVLDHSSLYQGFLNFGQRPFAYTAPSGFASLCTQNLPDPTIADGGLYMNTVLYSGNSSAQSITGVGFKPDWIWIKSRSNGALNHALFDVLRGTPRLDTSTTVAEGEYNQLNTYDSDGFTLKNETTVNGSGNTYVAWNWKANGAGSSNTDGTITSTVSANTTAGFSIVTYTGNATSGATVGHGLGVAPSFIICKSRTQSAVDWPTYHISTGNNGGCTLNESLAKATASTWWNNTTPSSTVVTLGSGAQTNGNTQSMVMYCFAQVAGYSAFGSITGNGSTDGPFCYLGFRPAFVMLKRTDSTSNWTILDFQREGYNVDNDPLYPNLSDAEGTADLADLLSNGFKLRSTDTSVNANGGTYVYAAFAQNPFKYSLAR